MTHTDSATMSAFFVSNGRHSGLSVLCYLNHDHVPPPQAREGIGYRRTRPQTMLQDGIAERTPLHTAVVT